MFRTPRLSRDIIKEALNYFKFSRPEKAACCSIRNAARLKFVEDKQRFLPQCSFTERRDKEDSVERLLLWEQSSPIPDDRGMLLEFLRRLFARAHVRMAEVAEIEFPASPIFSENEISLN